jgi:osmotically-inducible protein OsmY
MRNLVGAVLFVAYATQLAGCFPLVVAGAAGTAYSATDRRTVGAQADDKVIAVKVDNRISDEFGDKVHVNVTSFNRKVLLTGEVPNEATRSRLEPIASGVENVTTVVNETEVSGISSYTSRSSDAVITTRIKAELVNSTDIFANAFKVVTERGTVYLMGRVTKSEGDKASEIARSVSGVLRVVKVYDYVSEEELKQIRLEPQSNQKPGPKASS